MARKSKRGLGVDEEEGKRERGEEGLEIGIKVGERVESSILEGDGGRNEGNER
jgi:hypothetical protein